MVRRCRPLSAGLVDQVYTNTEPEAMLYVGTGAAVSVENTVGLRRRALVIHHIVCR